MNNSIQVLQDTNQGHRKWRYTLTTLGSLLTSSHILLAISKALIETLGFPPLFHRENLGIEFSFPMVKKLMASWNENQGSLDFKTHSQATVMGAGGGENRNEQ